MRLSIATLLTLTGVSFASLAPRQGGCSADNCARAVTGTRRGDVAQSSARADCSSFFARTVTVTAGNTETITQTPTPTAVPTYATACSGAARYSSACSCFGVTASTSTHLLLAPQTRPSAAPAPVAKPDGSAVTAGAKRRSDSATTPANAMPARLAPPAAFVSLILKALVIAWLAVLARTLRIVPRVPIACLGSLVC
ncbi:hypothetical protein W97_09363 [Coniosporium apollinis CBS 100218]|uniref:Uncharacterized protein n=1 Tax=Coniosporium apollinis (strain CBS 100218) TaxID=1168221 RepID=R7Z7I3_CONA1|nr:uncharacterized protein W97_09363 [Coniosporium apollinis CBS 100218]EON70097.1 hypothetical protein W97_09363 [Coniosporium apollinis CBS 100218]